MIKHFAVLALFTPLIVSAQDSGIALNRTISMATEMAAQLIPLLMSLAVVMFFWGIVKFIANMGNEESRKAGKSLMVWGMIAIFVMVSFWSIIGYVQESLGLVGGPIDTGTPPSMNNPIPSYIP